MTISWVREGEKAPDFRLPAADGNYVTLSALRGRRVVVYFIREFGCPICRRHSVQFALLYSRFQEAGADVVIVTPGSVEKAAIYARQLTLPFPVLADATRSVYRTYGLDRMQGLVQRSEILVIDDHGAVRFAQGHGLPTRLPEVEEVLAALEALPRQLTQGPRVKGSTQNQE